MQRRGAAAAVGEHGAERPDVLDLLDDLEPIHKAAYTLDLERCKLLIENDSCIVDNQTAGLFTPLMLVCRQTKNFDEAIKVAEYFLDKGANPNAQTRTGRTPLIESIASEHTALAMLLLDKGANPFLRDSNNWTALHQTAKWKNLIVMQHLIWKGTDIFAVDRWNRTALLMAVKSNFSDGVQLLLKIAGSRAEELANIAEEWGDTCVTAAAEGGSTKVLEVLIDNRANCNALRVHKRIDGGVRLAHAIALAALKRSHECVEMLLPHADMEIVAHTDLDPVIAAVTSSSEQCLTLLLKAGYSVEVPNRNRYIGEPTDSMGRLFQRPFVTALYKAVRKRNCLFVGTLLRAGAKMTYDSHCLSPFLYSFNAHGTRKILHLFLENDVDINLISDRSDCLVPDALRSALERSTQWHLLTLLRCGLDPALKYWCTCKSRFPLCDYFQRTYTHLGWDIPKLMKLLVYFSSGVPSCCDRVAKMADAKPEIPTLKHLCRLAIRKPLRTSQLLHGRFVENLPLPKTLKEYLDFQTLPADLKSLQR